MMTAAMRGLGRGTAFGALVFTALAINGAAMIAPAAAKVAKPMTRIMPVPPAPVTSPPAPIIPVGTGIFAAESALPFHAPDFSRIKQSDFQPAIEQGIAIQQAEIAAIARNPAPPTFANTIEVMERSGQMLDRVNAVFAALTGANTNPALDAIDTATSPQLAALNDAIYLDASLFARVKALHDGAAALGLNAEQTQVLMLTYDRFVHNGALLADGDKAKLRTINGRLSTLSTSFSQKLTAGTICCMKPCASAGVLTIWLYSA